MAGRGGVVLYYVNCIGATRTRKAVLSVKERNEEVEMVRVEVRVAKGKSIILGQGKVGRKKQAWKGVEELGRGKRTLERQGA